MDKKISEEEVAEKMLWGLWRGVKDEYKDSYKKDVWTHFENAIKNASFTDKLSKFLETFRRRIPCDIEGQHTDDILKVVQSGFDSEILTWLRDETTYLVMLVRFKNEERKEEYKKSKAKAKREEDKEFVIVNFDY